MRLLCTRRPKPGGKPVNVSKDNLLLFRRRRKLGKFEWFKQQLGSTAITLLAEGLREIPLEYITGRFLQQRILLRVWRFIVSKNICAIDKITGVNTGRQPRPLALGI